MQGTGEIQSGTARKTYRRRNVPGLHVRDIAQSQNDSAARLGNDFLKTHFTPIACSSIVRDKYSNSMEYMTQENYEYLRDSYYRYAELLGRPAPHDPGRNIGEGMSNLVDEMQNLVRGDDVNVNVDFNYERLYFTVYKAAPWEDWTVFWFPVRFMEKLTPRLRRICITFFHDLMRSNGFSTMLDDYDTEMVEDWFNQQMYDLCWEDQKKYQQVLDFYECGRARRLLDRISRKSYYKNLPGAIRRYKPANEYETELLALLQEGLQFIGDDKPTLMHYEYDPNEEEAPDTEPIPLERQVRVVYDLGDLFTDSLFDVFNCDQSETYVLAPYFTLQLTPQTDTLLQTDDYTDRFHKWAAKMVCHTE